MSMLNCRRTDGFTLLEVVAAVMILATSFVALISLQSQAVYSFQRVRTRLAALVLADDRMQRLLLKARGFDPIDMSNPVLQKKYDTVYSVKDEDVEPSDTELPPGMIFPARWTVRKYRVIIGWDAAGGEAGQYVLQRLVMVPVEAVK